MAIDHGLKINFADALQHTNKERVDRDQRAGMWRLDVAFLELGTELFQQPYLFFRQRQLLFRGGLLQP